jgi:hypothetical protein
VCNGYTRSKINKNMILVIRPGETGYLQTKEGQALCVLAIGCPEDLGGYPDPMCAETGDVGQDGGPPRDRAPVCLIPVTARLQRSIENGCDGLRRRN